MGSGDTLAFFDCDQHYYEPVDAFTRHLPKGWADRTVQVATIEGRTRYIVAGRVDGTVSNPTFDPIVKPGVMEQFFRGNPAKKELREYLAEREPLPDYYVDRDARIVKLDEQQIDRTWMLPTLGMGIEAGLEDDPEAAGVAFKAFNRYLLDDWGFDHLHRIYTAPYLAFGDVRACVAEIEFGLENGAKIFVVRPQAVHTLDGWKSPGDPYFDPIWARLDEAGVTLVVHIAEVSGAGLDRYLPYQGNIINVAEPALQTAVGHERAISNYLGAITCDRVFERFPKVRVASVENGAGFLPLLLAGLNRAGFQRPSYFASDPVQQFKDHVWVAPFWEDDLLETVGHIGVDRVLFGSDYPHPEGLAEPRHYEKVAAELEDVESIGKVMCRNTAALTGVN
ncbi:amidohydrolase family protein [Mycobacterium marseillense]|uniref:amidohydrolase family protein n=1 Tax=Mycobacterium marseillense TaxID=701042 RepID=UPI0011A85D2F|nr:amidohydrolase family protein [Mycobacterium marseillense]